jgi:hypothetical protein
MQESLARWGHEWPVGRRPRRWTACPAWLYRLPPCSGARRGFGVSSEAVPTAAVEAVEWELPTARRGPRVQLFSAAGTLVPGPHEEWTEVKLLAMGTGQAPGHESGKWVVQTEGQSCFARLAKADGFGRLALVDIHRPDAVRILDCPQALSGATQAGQEVQGEDTAAMYAVVHHPASGLETWRSGSGGHCRAGKPRRRSETAGHAELRLGSRRWLPGRPLATVQRVP